MSCSELWIFLPWKSHILNYLAHIFFTSNICWYKWSNIKIYFYFANFGKKLNFYWFRWSTFLGRNSPFSSDLSLMLSTSCCQKSAFHLVITSTSRKNELEAGRLADTLMLFQRNLYGVSIYTSILGNGFRCQNINGEG